MSDRDLTVVVLSSYGMFQLSGLKLLGQSGPSFPGNSLLAPSAGLGSNRIWDVKAGRQYGPFHIEVGSLRAAPTQLGDQWEDVVEFSAECVEPVAISDIEDGPQAQLTIPLGSYRVRVCARGRSNADEHVEFDSSESESPSEYYEVLLWPAGPSEPSVLRDSEPLVDNDEEYWPDDGPPEEQAGLLAARAIWRDVTATEGTRTLSGERTTITVRREFPMTPRKAHHQLVLSCAWPPSMGTYGGDELRVGDTSIAEATAPIGRDRRYTWESDGDIVRTVIEHDVPTRLRTSWNWVRATSRNTPGSLPFLNPPTFVLMTIDLVSRRKGAARCQVTLEHEGVPVEWADDLRALWEWDLATALERAYY